MRLAYLLVSVASLASSPRFRSTVALDCLTASSAMRWDWLICKYTLSRCGGLSMGMPPNFKKFYGDSFGWRFLLIGVRFDISYR
jgi:hypothetical protein